MDISHPWTKHSYPRIKELSIYPKPPGVNSPKRYIKTTQEYISHSHPFIPGNVVAACPLYSRSSNLVLNVFFFFLELPCPQKRISINIPISVSISISVFNLHILTMCAITIKNFLVLLLNTHACIHAMDSFINTIIQVFACNIRDP